MPYAKYIYAATAVVLLAEIIAGRHRGIYNRNTVLVLLGCIGGSAVTRPLAAILIAWIMTMVMPWWSGALTGTPFWIAFPIVLFLNELGFYGGHRLAHEVKGGRYDWLWKLHRTHHSARFMNVGVTLRVNPFWSVVVPTPWILGAATYLGLGAAAGLTLLVMYGWNLITHADFRWDDPIRRHRLFGPAFRALEHFVVSPGIHHSHHGYGKDGGNFRNYAVTLSCIDWMFGTLHIPQGRPWKYGVPGPNAAWYEEAFFPVVSERPAIRNDAGAIA